MGNTASFSCFSINRSKAKTAMLLDTRGNVRKITLPVRSAELMIQELGHVIVPVEELPRTRRISALPADRELVAGKVYLLVPASRVHSKASELEMAIAENKSGQRKKVNVNKAKVSPLSTLTEKDGEIEVSSFQGTLNGISSRQLGRQPRWNPVLDPILESSRDFGEQF